MLPSNCAYLDSSATVDVAENYGTWDGSNVWWSDQNVPQIYKIVPGNPITYYTYSITNTAQPRCMTWDGTNIWVGSDDNYAVLSEYTQTGAQVGAWQLRSAGDAQGGIQSILWDGQFIWAAVALTPSVDSGGAVMKWNTSTASVNLTAVGLTNVNGISEYIDPVFNQEYILAACTGFWGKINASTGSWPLFVDNSEERLTNDGTYVYLCNSTTPGQVQKFNISTGTSVSTWNIGNGLNQITYISSLSELWTVDTDSNVNVTDTFGNPECFYAGTGLSDAIYAPNLGTTGSVFTLYSNNNSGSPVNSSVVNRYVLSSAPLTPTSTPTATPTGTPLATITASPTVTDTPTATKIPTSNATHTFTESSTDTPSVSPTPTNTPNWTATATPTYNAVAPTASPTIGFK